jgi:hypothetical protein
MGTCIHSCTAMMQGRIMAQRITIVDNPFEETMEVILRKN